MRREKHKRKLVYTREDFLNKKHDEDTWAYGDGEGIGARAVDDQRSSSDKNVGEYNERQQGIPSVNTAKIEEKSTKTSVSVYNLYGSNALHSSNCSIDHNPAMQKQSRGFVGKNISWHEEKETVGTLEETIKYSERPRNSNPKV